MNEAIPDKLNKLIAEFKYLNDEEKALFMQTCIRHCKLLQVQMLYREAERILARDFVDILPVELTEKIFSYLDAISLCQVSSVNNKWRRGSNSDKLWHNLCERKQWIPFSKNKTLPKKPEALLCRSSAVKQSIVQTYKAYNFCQDSSESLPLERISKWKDLFVRICHLERNWARGLYIVKPVLRGHSQRVTCMDCNEELIVSGSSDSTVRLWDMASNYDCKQILSNFGGSVKCLQLKDFLLVTGCADSIVRVFDVETCAMVRELLGHEGSVDRICVDGGIIASASSVDRMIKVWSMHDWSCLHDLLGHTDDIEILKLANNVLVSASWDESVRVWDVQAGVCLHSLHGHTEVVMCCQLDEVKVVTGGADGHTIIWELEQGHLRQTLHGHAEVYCLEFNDDIIASGYADSTVRIWSIHGDLRHILDGHIGIVRCIKLKGKRLISGGDCKRVIVWDSESGELINVVHRHPTSLHLMWVDETRIITASPETPGTVTVLSYWA